MTGYFHVPRPRSQQNPVTFSAANFITTKRWWMGRPHQPSRLAVFQQCILARFGTMTFDTWDMLTANYDELLHPHDAVTCQHWSTKNDL